MPLSPTRTPSYVLYRTVAANDSLPMTDPKQGINMKGYKTANIQIIPAGGGNPTVTVLYWSEEATKFVQEHTTIAKAGVGVNTPYEFSVDCNGRILFIAISSLSAGTAKILVSGFELNLPD